MSRVLRIERVAPRPGKIDHAYKDKKGFYTLGNPSVSSDQRKRRFYCKLVLDLGEAADWVERGWHIRMGDDHVSASLIQPSMVRIVRAA